MKYTVTCEIPTGGYGWKVPQTHKSFWKFSAGEQITPNHMPYSNTTKWTPVTWHGKSEQSTHATSHN